MDAARKQPLTVTDVAGARPSTPADSPSSRPDTLPWYAVWVMSNAEFVVEDALRGHKIETFLPTWTDITQWSDRKKVIQRPLFRGYLFARCEDRRLPEIVRIAGVIDILPECLNPAPVDPADIDNVRRMLAAGVAAKPCDYVTGDEVLIDSGPLAGVRGIVQRSKNGTRVVVKIELLRRAVSVEVDYDDLVKEKKAA